MFLYLMYRFFCSAVKKCIYFIIYHFSIILLKNYNIMQFFQVPHFKFNLLLFLYHDHSICVKAINIVKKYPFHVKLGVYFVHYVVTYIFYSALHERMLRASRAGVRDDLAQHVYVDFLQASNLNTVGFTTPWFDTPFVPILWKIILSTCRIRTWGFQWYDVSNNHFGFICIPINCNTNAKKCITYFLLWIIIINSQPIKIARN